MTTRRETERTVSIPDDLGIRLDKPHSRAGARFRPTRITERLNQSDKGWAQYTVDVHGPVQTKAGHDSQAAAGNLSYGSGYGHEPLDRLPKRLRGYLVGPDVLAKVIALPKDGAR